ncbi:MAG: U32 family peptidase [Clostridia bacterium]|nr:U32 family peptidase [Clostridia bacterium]
MRITAGAASAEQAAAYIAAGADEIFCGYVPDSWTEDYGLTMPLNRREVRYCPVQTGGENELRLLTKVCADRGVPVSLTFNAPCYLPRQLEEASDIIDHCRGLGIHQFIVADPALAVTLHRRGLTDKISLHISGEAGEINRYTLQLWQGLGAKRIILHRKVGMYNMASLISAAPDSMEYEAFAMNEMCHFNGAFCAGLHCDELAHLCHLPWKAVPVREGSAIPPVPKAPEHPQVPGHSGCGLCALWDMVQMGITHLKAVGRGAPAEDMAEDIFALKTALQVLEASPCKADYLREMKRRIFPDGCSGCCYYPVTDCTR